MSSDRPVIRIASDADIPAVFRVRTSVRENALTADGLHQLGITPEIIAKSLREDSRGWVAELGGEIVAFVIANRGESTIFALFVQPGHEGLGLGAALMDRAEQWLWDQGAASIWLTTGGGTRAEGFYRRRGWTIESHQPNGEVRLTLARPATGPAAEPKR
jgi:GNAT superfamily N-acetyltransferase